MIKLKGRLDPASTESQASASAFEPECQILTCTKLGRLPVSPPSLRSHLSPLFSLTSFSLYSRIRKKEFCFFSSLHFSTFGGGTLLNSRQFVNGGEQREESSVESNGSCGGQSVFLFAYGTVLVAGEAPTGWSRWGQIPSFIWWRFTVGAGKTTSITGPPSAPSQNLPPTTQKKTKVIKLSVCGPWWCKQSQDSAIIVMWLRCRI